MIRVALADDHEIVRNGIKMILEDDKDIQVVWEASDGQETLDNLASNRPDVLVLDIRMPILTGLEVAQKVKKETPSQKILLLTMHDDSEYIRKSLEYGADGYLLKDTNKSEFNKAIHMVHNGQKYYSGDISGALVDYFMNSGLKAGNGDSVAHGSDQDYQITRREKEIMQMIYDGISNKDIAERLNKSVRTIETHRFNIMKKLEVSNITEMLRKIEKEGLLN